MQPDEAESTRRSRRSGGGQTKSVIASAIKKITSKSSIAPSREMNKQESAKEFLHHGENSSGRAHRVVQDGLGERRVSKQKKNQQENPRTPTSKTQTHNHALILRNHARPHPLTCTTSLAPQVSVNRPAVKQNLRRQGSDLG